MKKNKLLIISIVFLIITVGVCSISFYMIEPDYLWHIKAGEFIFNNGILKKDVFSWYLYGKYWMSHEWLFELFIFTLKKCFGVFHVFIYLMICVSILLFLCFNYNKKDIFKNVLFSIVWISLFLLIIFNIHVRPHMLSYCLLALTVYILYDFYNNNKSKKIYFLPLIGIIWSNVHGGSSNLIYILGIIFFISYLFRFKFTKIESTNIDKKDLFKLFVVIILCVFSIIINIHGIKMLVYPYFNIMDSKMINNIYEWRSTSLNDPLHYIYILFVLFVFLVMLFSKKRIRLIDFLLFLFTTYLGLKSIRFWFYSYIISSFFIFYYVDKRKIDKGTEIGVLGLSLIFLFIFIMNSKNVFSYDYSCFLKKKDINKIKELNPKRLFNMYDYGGDLIYNDIKVFIDGRADLYSSYNYSDYLDISNAKNNYISLIKKYNFDYMLIDDKYSIGDYLKNNDDYTLMYKNKNIRIYKKITDQ